MFKLEFSEVTPKLLLAAVRDYLAEITQPAAADTYVQDFVGTDDQQPVTETAAELAAKQAAAHTQQTAVVTVEVDGAGTPWDGRIHAGTKTKKVDGTWKRKPGISDVEYAAVLAEITDAQAARNAATAAAGGEQANAGVGTAVETGAGGLTIDDITTKATELVTLFVAEGPALLNQVLTHFGAVSESAGLSLPNITCLEVAQYQPFIDVSNKLISNADGVRANPAMAQFILAEK